MNDWIELTTKNQFSGEESKTLMKKENIYHIQEVKFDGMTESQCEITYSNGQFIQTVTAFVDYDALKRKLGVL